MGAGVGATVGAGVAVVVGTGVAVGVGVSIDVGGLAWNVCPVCIAGNNSVLAMLGCWRGGDAVT